jgi:hypothetical protein
MGAVYRPKYKGADGTIRESAVWWVRYRQHGKTLRQSTETTDHAKALKILERQQGKVALNVPISLAGDRLTLDAAAELIRWPDSAAPRASRGSRRPRLKPTSQRASPQARNRPPSTGSWLRYPAWRRSRSTSTGSR